MRQFTAQKVYDIILVLLFLCMVTLPLVKGMLTKDMGWSQTEKRALVELPAFPESWKGVAEYFQLFEKYYNDHFGYRETMILRYHREMEKRFGIAGTPLVLKGLDDWLFFTGDNLLEDFRGELQLSKEELDSWYDEQKRRYRWLGEHNILYLTFSPPNKQSIYPEMFPPELSAAQGKSRMFQLHEYLQHKTSPFYVNLFGLLEASKSEWRIYFQRDTHWNDYGAYVSFEQIMGKIQEHYPGHEFVNNFIFYDHYFRKYGGDLATVLMTDKKSVEPMPKLRRRAYCSEEIAYDYALTDISTKTFEKPLLKKCSNASLRAVVFSDSFIERLEPFLSENFEQILYLQKNYDERNVVELMDTFKPDIVIEERVERNYFRQLDTMK